MCVSWDIPAHRFPHLVCRNIQCPQCPSSTFNPLCLSASRKPRCCFSVEIWFISYTCKWENWFLWLGLKQKKKTQCDEVALSWSEESHTHTRYPHVYFPPFILPVFPLCSCSRYSSLSFLSQACWWTSCHGRVTWCCWWIHRAGKDRPSLSTTTTSNACSTRPASHTLWLSLVSWRHKFTTHTDTQDTQTKNDNIITQCDMEKNIFLKD